MDATRYKLKLLIVFELLKWVFVELSLLQFFHKVKVETFGRNNNYWKCLQNHILILSNSILKCSHRHSNRLLWSSKPCSRAANIFYCFSAGSWMVKNMERYLFTTRTVHFCPNIYKFYLVTQSLKRIGWEICLDVRSNLVGSYGLFCAVFCAGSGQASQAQTVAGQPAPAIQRIQPGLCLQYRYAGLLCGTVPNRV